jgi:homoserine kinase
MAISTATITVPATTANIGPGFDCLGAALTLYNQFTFTRLDSDHSDVRIVATGIDADRVQVDSSNLAYKAFVKLYNQLKLPPPAVKLDIKLDVPLARGLGSSATAIVGGLVGANALAGSPLTQDAILRLAVEMEGHPDNVVPALLGGCYLTTPTEGGEVVCPIPWHESVIPVIVIPAFELSTADARQVLPDHYSRADVIFNIAHLGLLLRGLETGQAAWLQVALNDRIHQPYRHELIPGYDTIRAAALNAGAHGLVISGAGPTLLALTDEDHAVVVESAMAIEWAHKGISVRTKVLHIDTDGTIANVR